MADFATRFRWFRIGVLLVVLAAVAWNQWASIRKIRTWVEPLVVAIYPAPESPEEARFAQSLQPQDFAPISDFLAREALRHGLGFEPDVRFVVTEPLDAFPPLPHPEIGWLGTLLYSLKLRWWSFWELGRVEDPEPDIRVVLLLHPARKGAVLDHSLGLMRGQVALVHAFADRELTGMLRVVVTHELMHIAGATDRYGADGRPRFPEGYANPERGRNRDQTQAVLMAGSIPLADGSVRLPTGLDECLIGRKTAREIDWIEPETP
ncbi:MAG TPA: hypothetical protein RMG48_11640 [Myxococcales bacterium LLY-WYZ-16_1]|nr:hypothetical protein [Myxococcales bacterium LLY-WYZ-16_1]